MVTGAGATTGASLRSSGAVRVFGHGLLREPKCLRLRWCGSWEVRRPWGSGQEPKRKKKKKKGWPAMGAGITNSRAFGQLHSICT